MNVGYFFYKKRSKGVIISPVDGEFEIHEIEITEKKYKGVFCS